MVYSNIVKVLEKQENSYGTGIIIAEDKVLTVEHVVRGKKSICISWDDQDYSATVEFTDKYIAIISVENEEFKEKYNSISNKRLFTMNEYVTEETPWYIEGYITSNLDGHFMQGNGVFIGGKKEELFSLGRVNVGAANNYQGLSGSPVIVRNRAIGIVQLQNWDMQGTLSIKFLPIQRFVEHLPQAELAEPQYIVELNQWCSQQCCEMIEKNKSSAKYIPDIYVEERNYKDNLRYFSMPLLFINKLIDDLKGFDFSKVNEYLKSVGRLTVDFTGYSGKIESEEFEDTVESLKQNVRRGIDVFEEWDKKVLKTDSIEERYLKENNRNSFFKWELKDIYQQLEFLNYRFLLLTRNAGQGKTNFLCDYTENFIMKNGISALYYNAAGFCEKPADVIIRELTLSGKYDIKYVKEILTKRWEETRIPLIVVIDGLNENNTLNNFGEYMQQSMCELMDMSFLKIVMTTRNELLEERFGMLNSKNLGEKFCRINMMGHDDERFANRIFEGYLQYFDIQIIRDTLVNRTYDLLTNDTLLLRFFCEVNRGKRQVYMYDVYKYALFSEYFNNKKTEMKNKVPNGDAIFEKMMNSICEYMIENKSFNNIPKDVLKYEELQLLDILLEADVIFKDDQMVKRGFTDQYVEVLSFTFDEFRDYCLTKYLINREGAQQSLPIIWNEMCSEQWNILEGVEKYLFFLARTSVPDILPILQQNERYAQIYWENVWNLEDKDFENSDIDKWRNQFLNLEFYSRRIVKFLIRRRNREYFQNVSIDLLFDFMNGLATNPGQFELFVRTFFPTTQYDKYGQPVWQKNRVFHCDQIVHEISEALDEQDDKVDYYDFLKLSVYLYDVMPEEIELVWVKANENYPDEIVNVAESFLKSDEIPKMIGINIRKVLEKIIDKSSNEMIDRLYNKVNYETDYTKVSSILDNIWG